MTEPGYSPEFTATCEGLTAGKPSQPCLNYTARSWSPKADEPEDDNCVNCGQPEAAHGRPNPKHAPITVNVENLPAVELCMNRLAALGEFLDRLHDEAFPNDPYLLGRLHAEMERLGYGSLHVRNGDPRSPTE